YSLIPTPPRPPLFPSTTLFRSSIPRCEAASISTTSSDVPDAIARQMWHSVSGCDVGPRSQFSALARMRANEVLPVPRGTGKTSRSEEHTSELQSRGHLVCRLLL